MAIIQPNTHAPTPDDRVDEYLAHLSNLVERTFLDGGDPREVMVDVTYRQQRGTRLQLAMIGGAQ